MKFGLLYLTDYHPEVHGEASSHYARILDQVQAAEQLGFHSVWFGEHHVGGYAFGSPSVIATAAAARTKRIRLGTGVSLVALNNPIRLAEEYAMLDVLSGGRLEYGIGRGILKYDYDILGYDEAESQARYREGTELVIKAWTAQEPFSFDGRFWKLKDYSLFPKPMQKPYPPIFGGGTISPESYEWIGSLGIDLCTVFFVPLPSEGLRENVRIYRKSLVDHGFDPTQRDVAGVYHFYCGEDPREAHSTGEKILTRYFQFTGRLDKRGGLHTSEDYRHYHGSISSLFKGKNYDDLDRERLILVGDPPALIERIRWAQEYYGTTYLLLTGFQGGLTHEQYLASLERFTRYVMPAFTTPDAANARSGN
jgi:alkanesulfonate monooxygenase SsuD/methylene tetrahydromethanopterin reductase-like flavin-dependent oxidoreductase (luciferase family)